MSDVATDPQQRSRRKALRVVVVCLVLVTVVCCGGCAIVRAILFPPPEFHLRNESVWEMRDVEFFYVWRSGGVENEVFASFDQLGPGEQILVCPP